MNYETYTLLRQVARDIRRPALSLGQTSVAIEGVIKAVGFLVDEVHLNGDVSLSTRFEFATALRKVADAVEAQ